MKQAIQKHGKALVGSEKFRFGAVGVANTAVDVVSYNILVSIFGVPLIIANVISTTAAMLTSFVLNKKAVFKGSEKGGAKQLALFFAVTFTGIWLVQGGTLVLVSWLLQPLDLPQLVQLNLPKFAGICVGLVWNYLWYSRLVFRAVNREK